MKKDLIIVRGGGDLATGMIHRLWSAGFPVMSLETEKPAAVRRQVAVCETVYDGEAKRGHNLGRALYSGSAAPIQEYQEISAGFPKSVSSRGRGRDIPEHDRDRNDRGSRMFKREQRGK